ncbi:MAG: DsbE family thiol:disulfide interchange protein [Granulosicoccus sp.]|nr:DsbE family thiol:disulfide interchange protein [Granulosicoccus sp.]
MAFKLLPLVVFLALAGFLAKGLTLNPSELPSPLVDKEAPPISSNTLPEGGPRFDSASLAGRVWILNVWASWCGPCIQEHPFMVSLAERTQAPLVGLNYKDVPDEAMPWLARYGNPYTHLLDDRQGDVGLEWGVYGVPETFIIDHDGRIRHKHVGPVDQTALESKLLPIISQLQQESS